MKNDNLVALAQSYRRDAILYREKERRATSTRSAIYWATQAARAERAAERYERMALK